MKWTVTGLSADFFATEETPWFGAQASAHGPVGKIDGPGKRNKTHLNPFPLFFTKLT